MALGHVACGGGGGGGGSPTEPVPSLTVTASPTSIGATGNSEVVVQASSTGGGPGGGLLVELSTTLGRLDVTELVTDAQGRATTRLRGDGTAGVARLRAQVRGTTTAATAEVRIGLDRSARVEVQPAAIAGSQRATVSVTVFEPGGAPAGPGVPVTVATTLGSLAATALATDGNGTARTTLGTGGQVGTARLTVTVDGAGPITVDVPLRPPYALTLAANPPAIGASGRSTISVRVDALDPAAARGGLDVQLAATLGRLEATQLRTNSQGLAATTLSPDGRSGTANVTATMPGAVPATATVQIDGGLVIQLSVAPARLPASGSATVEVLVVTTTGSPAPTGTEVHVSATLGRLDADRLRTDAAGRASTVLRGDGRTGAATVTATVTGTAVSAAQTVTFE